MVQVTVDRKLLWGLGLGCSVALLGLAFLLGRQSAEPRVAHATQVPGGPQPMPALELSPSAPPSLTTPPSPETPSATAVPSTVVPAAASGDAPMRQAVAAYFASIDALQPGGLGGEPQALAQEIVGGLGKGDSSGLDRIIQQTEATRQKLSSLQPPAPCVAHHRACLASLQESLGLLRSLRGAADASDGSQLAHLTANAQGMQARAEALQREDEALRRRFGLRN